MSRLQKPRSMMDKEGDRVVAKFKGSLRNYEGEDPHGRPGLRPGWLEGLFAGQEAQLRHGVELTLRAGASEKHLKTCDACMRFSQRRCVSSKWYRVIGVVCL